MVSLETRLKRHLLLGILLVGVVLGTAVRFQVVRQQGELLDYQLEQVARALILVDLTSSLMTWDNDPSLHLDVQIWDSKGQRLYRSSGQIELPISTQIGFSEAISGPQSDAVRLRVFTLNNEQRTVQVMHSQELRDALSWEAELEVLLPTLLVVLLGAGMVAATIRHGLAPIRELDDELKRRSTHTLNPVTLPHAPAELANVIHTLNQLLKQLDTSMQAHKRFIANAAHELRTPMTALNLEVDNLLSGLNQEQQLTTVKRLKLSVQRAQHLLQQMLTLARLENQGEFVTQNTVDLLGLTQDAMVGLSSMGSKKGIEFSLANSGFTLVRGDADDLRVLIDNLLVNALKFSAPNCCVEVNINEDDQTVVWLLRDHGPGISPLLRSRVLLPFVREDPSIDGAGLGLSIALEIATKHGASLSLETPSEGTGLQVRLKLPKLHRRDSGDSS